MAWTRSSPHATMAPLKLLSALVRSHTNSSFLTPQWSTQYSMSHLWSHLGAIFPTVWTCQCSTKTASPPANGHSGFKSPRATSRAVDPLGRPLAHKGFLAGCFRFHLGRGVSFIFYRGRSHVSIGCNVTTITTSPNPQEATSAKPSPTTSKDIVYQRHTHGKFKVVDQLIGFPDFSRF